MDFFNHWLHGLLIEGQKSGIIKTILICTSKMNKRLIGLELHESK